MKKVLVFICIAALLAAFLCGCGSTGSETKAEAPAASAETAQPAQEQAVEPAAEPEPAKEETEPVQEETPVAEPALPDGEYSVEFNTDSSMFHVNESLDGKGVLTVKDGVMTVHVSLVSKSILNLFVGTAEEAKADGAELLQPTTDKVTYSDGYTEEVYGFDIPVQALDTDFELAIIGKKGVWYDHIVSVSSPAEE